MRWSDRGEGVAKPTKSNINGTCDCGPSHRPDRSRKKFDTSGLNNTKHKRFHSFGYNWIEDSACLLNAGQASIANFAGYVYHT
jgi:hypothetical protein